MVRLYYVGTKPITDKRLAGVDIRPGTAVDVPERLGPDTDDRGRLEPVAG